MNKKGSMLALEELIKAILALILIILLVGAIVKIWNATHPEQRSQEIKDIQRLVSEIKDLDWPSTPYDTITVPVMSRDYEVRAGSKDGLGTAVRGCYKDYCLCFIKEGREYCETFNLRKEFGLKNKEYKTVKFSGSPTTNQPITLTRTDATTVIIS